MGKTITTAPDFYTAEEVVSLTPPARELFCVLWIEADEHGVLEWKVRTLQHRYPILGVISTAVVDELVAAGLLRFQVRDERTLAQVARVQGLEQRSAAAASAAVKKAAKPKQLALTVPVGPSVITIPLVGGAEFAVTQAMVDEWAQAFPAVDVALALKQMRIWCLDNPSQRKTAAGVRRFVGAWLTKEQNRGGARRHLQQQGANAEVAERIL